MCKKNLVGLAALSGLCCSFSVQALAPEDAAATTENSANLAFVGDSTRLGLGFDTDHGLLRAELLHVFSEDDQDAWIGEAWLADTAGGFKLNYHWLGEDAMQADAVNKLFLAVDQNDDEDQKATLGFGREYEELFWGAYGSSRITGDRQVSSQRRTETSWLDGDENGRPYVQPLFTTTTTNIFEKPYDWGVGLRVGQFDERDLMRIRAGVDYEQGDYNASQITFSLGWEKYFANTSHSIALNTELFTKEGDFETEHNDARLSLIWRYDLGTIHRPARQVRRVPVTVQEPAPPAPAHAATRLVKTEVSFTEDTFFAFDSSKLSDSTQADLNTVAKRLREPGFMGRVRISGHTCDIGTDQYNQALSKRRANSVADALTALGIPREQMIVEAMGESQPRFPNDGETNRARNRRVDVEFVTQVSAETPVEDAPPVTRAGWREEEVEQVPAWLERALRNPVSHKRAVDVYRYEEEKVNRELGPREYLNRDPEAQDDSYSLMGDSSQNPLDVLANDGDPDDDNLEITSVTQPAHGSVANNGSSLLYTPAPGYSGADGFSYSISDGNGGTSSANVSLVIIDPNHAPATQDDSASAPSGGTVSIPVLANDSDPDGDTLEVIGFGQPVFGSAAIEAGQSIRYTADAYWCGVETFSYTISDGRGGSAWGQVSVMVGLD